MARRRDPHESFLPRLARFCYRRRRLVLVLWALVLIAITVVSQTAGNRFAADFRLDGYDSQKAMDLLEIRFPDWSGINGDIVFRSDKGVMDPTIRDRMVEVSQTVSGLDKVVAVHDPYGDNGSLLVSEDGQIGYIAIQFDAPTEPDIPAATIAGIREAAEVARGDDLQIELGGSVFAATSPPTATEAIGIVAAMIILIIAFGSVLAMGLPIGTALLGIGIGVGSVTLFSHLTTVPAFGIEVATMISIGIGIDYALFIITRYRDGLAEGLEPEAATVMAIDTAGRAVLFAGMTVMISLAGMIAVDVKFMRGLGIACATIVGVTVLVSITMLPALLGFVGYNIDKLRVGRLGGRPLADEKTFWFRWSRFLQRHPWPAFVVSLVFLGILAAPTFSMRLGSAGEGSSPESNTTRRAYDLKAEGFGAGSNGPFLLTAQVPEGADNVDLLPLVGILRDTDGVADAMPLVTDANGGFTDLTGGDAAILLLNPTSAPSEKATTDLLRRLRKDVLPKYKAETGVIVHVGGMAPLFDDLAAKLQAALPVFIVIVLGLAFILLMAVFRSVLVPLKAVFMNLLSIGAAYGLIVAVFQWGWGKSIIGVGAGGPIESFFPMMLFAILFGLSMDYEVFMLSRVKEEYDHTGDNSLAVADGLSHTARVITAAAAIMVVVFGVFMFSDGRIIKMFGVGLSMSILIDATVVRLLLVPSSMELMGKANWWFPRWLEWIPMIHIEGSTHTSAPAGKPAR